MPSTTATTPDQLVALALKRADANRRLPESTYRLQFHAGFTFRDATAIVPYLAELGVTHLYASPYLKARPGSTHGYDVIDHGRLNPELGTDADYEALLQALADAGMSHVLDTVPNHVGVGTNDNAWWNDVLESGPASYYGEYFDIAWHGSPRPELHGKVLLPVLGNPYGQVLENGELTLKYGGDGSFGIHYYDRRFPVSPTSYERILASQSSGPLSAVVERARALNAAEQAGGDDARAARHQAKLELKAALARSTEDDPSVAAAVAAAAGALNGKPGDARSFDALDALLNEQHYRLAYWRVASDEINYRRFFDINDLAALSMERQEVFDATHALILKRLADGSLTGLRIDHPDGLYDPRQYFERLQVQYLLACARREFQGTDAEWRALEPAVRERLQPTKPWPLYVVGEKILAVGEPLPEDWALDGTSGYDFLNEANGLFISPAAEQPFTDLYHSFTGETTAFEDLVYAKKKLILQISLASELQMLAHQCDRVAQSDRRTRDFTLSGLREALREVIACFPVYRSYTSDEGPRPQDRGTIRRSLEEAKRRNPAIEPAIFDFLGRTLLDPDSGPEASRHARLRLAGKFQQLTAPVTAKGIEDTAFYIDNRMISLNEVGGDPARFGVTPDTLHRYLQDRQARWPYALSALSTHDTKRSEDVRARLNALSEIPDEWAQCVRRWAALNEKHKSQVDGRTAPDRNEEYLLYQTLVGAWPIEPATVDERAQFVKRIAAYMEKALREAKQHTSWTSPNKPYDEAVTSFVQRVLDEGASAEFLVDVRRFVSALTRPGLINSLAQTVLRLTAPGVPDTYQGMELWDFSLVDPDNRRPVDYARRRELLNTLRADAAADLLALVERLTASPEDGRIKLWVTHVCLELRRQMPGLFSRGEYRPLLAEGDHAAHLFAFERRLGNRSAVVVIPRLTASSAAPVTNTQLPVSSVPYRNAFTGERLDASGGTVELSNIFRHFPVAVLVSNA